MTAVVHNAPDIWEVVFALTLDGQVDPTYESNGQYSFSSHSNTRISRMHEDYPFGELLLGGFDEWRTVYKFPYSGGVPYSFTLPYPDDAPITGIDHYDGARNILATKKILIRTNLSGSGWDATFGTSGRVYLNTLPKFISVNNLATLSDGKILAFGTYQGQNALQRFLSSGKPDTFFGDSSISVVDLDGNSYNLNKSITALPNGKVLLVTDKGIMRLKPAGIPTQSNLAMEQKTKWEVFPNPSNGRFTIKFWPVSESKDITIMNMLGQTIWRGKIVEGETHLEIDIFRQPAGIYSVRYQSSGGMRKELRIIKE